MNYSRTAVDRYWEPPYNYWRQVKEVVERAKPERGVKPGNRGGPNFFGAFQAIRLSLKEQDSESWEGRKRGTAERGTSRKLGKKHPEEHGKVSH